MIYDHRTYTCRPGTIKKQMALYAEHGWQAQCKILGLPIMFGVVETGDVNSYVHIWRYEDAGDRAQKRAALAADSAWIAYLKLSAEAGNLVSQVNQILTPTDFFKSRPD
ncbi:NIPSNAP family protein [Lentibacter algarum]|uniref:NIPSNAP family protein n=1 Tax=Lentibacter algarum TaxID=576131 RepID=UPI001C089D81|nr:NIPSNAP family protein [Lentibacter algarum]MBU2983669.1 NIPSNAP family protein [Lentibacter algarum]